MTPLAQEWVQKAEEDFAVAHWVEQAPTASFNAICFHCQQCIEKYLKARLAEARLAFPWSHDLNVLLDLVVPVEPDWERLREPLKRLTPFAIETRYPGVSARAEDVAAAMEDCAVARKHMRETLGLEE